MMQNRSAQKVCRKREQITEHGANMGANMRNQWIENEIRKTLVQLHRKYDQT